MQSVTKIGAALIALHLISACENASFNSSTSPARKHQNSDDGSSKNGDPTLDSKGDTKDNPGISGGVNDVGGYPETKSLDSGGWIGNAARKEFDKLFNSSNNGDNCSGCSADDGQGNDGQGNDGQGNDGQGNDGQGNDGQGNDGQGNDGNLDSGSNTDKDANSDGSIGSSGDQAGNAGFDDGVTGVLWIPCDKSTGGGKMEGGFRGYKNSLVRVAGEFCPTKTGTQKLTVLFVVDFSGSMSGFLNQAPNDPTVGGTCGRLRAAETVINRFGSSEFQGTELKVGMVGFSSSASIRVPFSDVGGFRNSLNVGAWCGSDNIFISSTNYRAAFDQATQALAGIEGDKAVFFISDGSPTFGGSSDNASSHQEAGLQAAQRLRNNTKDLTLNTIFLGNNDGQAIDPRGYLEQVTGDKSLVTLVETADDLVKAIATISVFKLKIAKNDVAASLTPEGLGKRSVGIDSLFKSSTKAGRIVFSTAPFKLSGTKGKDVMNVLEVVGKTSSGDTLRSEARIKFTQFD